jgi:anti-sigma regulatory factor (Ser/Thr protein kinase)
MRLCACSPKFVCTFLLGAVGYLPFSMGEGIERQRSFGPRPESVRAARAFVRGLAHDAGANPDDAELLASELAANAVRHADSGFEVRVPKNGDAFRVEVANDAPEMVAALRKPTEEGGRGLHIVEALAQRWGVDADDREKVVWFELPIS